MKKISIFDSAISLLLLLLVILFTTCTKDDTGGSGSGTQAAVSSLSCSQTSYTGVATEGEFYGDSAIIPYQGGNGGTYSATTPIPSQGITGLLATLIPGTLSNGSGNLYFLISGVPDSSGVAHFTISFGGQVCIIDLNVESNNINITYLDCSGAYIFNDNARSGVFYSDTVLVPCYNSGQGSSYGQGNAIFSQGVTGLSATRIPGTVDAGNSDITYAISGVPMTQGVASFPITFGGQSCSFQISVSASNSNPTVSALNCSSAMFQGLPMPTPLFQDPAKSLIQEVTEALILQIP